MYKKRKEYLVLKENFLHFTDVSAILANLEGQDLKKFYAISDPTKVGHPSPQKHGPSTF